MRRLVLAGALAVSLVSTGAATAAPTQDSVTGSGSVNFDGRVTRFAIDARSGPSGENPVGSALFEFPEGGVISGPITCLAVDGRIAIFNVQDASEIFTFIVADPDDARFSDEIGGTFGRSASDCSSPVPLFIHGGVRTGEIVVVDAPPLPVSTAQCKNGGWKTYGVFKNQGDCVSFVATKGKNQPAGH
jgi:hypothetical protein